MKKEEVKPVPLQAESTPSSKTVATGLQSTSLRVPATASNCKGPDGLRVYAD
jgi:hypothetical protein